MSTSCMESPDPSYPPVTNLYSPGSSLNAIKPSLSGPPTMRYFVISSSVQVVSRVDESGGHSSAADASTTPNHPLSGSFHSISNVISSRANAVGTSISSRFIATLHPSSPSEHGTIGASLLVVGAWYPNRLRTTIKAHSNPHNIGSRERILTIIAISLLNPLCST